MVLERKREPLVPSGFPRHFFVFFVSTSFGYWRLAYVNGMASLTSGMDYGFWLPIESDISGCYCYVFFFFFCPLFAFRSFFSGRVTAAFSFPFPNPRPSALFDFILFVHVRAQGRKGKGRPIWIYQDQHQRGFLTDAFWWWTGQVIELEQSFTVILFYLYRFFLPLFIWTCSSRPLPTALLVCHAHEFTA